MTLATPTELLFCLFLYSLGGWCMETIFRSIRDMKFTRHGFLNLPFSLTYGLLFALMRINLPELSSNYVLMYLVVIIDLIVTRQITAFLKRRLTKGKLEPVPSVNSVSRMTRFVLTALTALTVQLLWLITYPLVLFMYTIIPQMVMLILCWTFVLLIIADLGITIGAIRHHTRTALLQNRLMSETQNFGSRISDHLWRRLQKAYPGIRETNSDAAPYTFAKGLCLDKLCWVFLVSGVAGDIIETLYCRLVGGSWMLRSSILYIPLSAVWGLGGVLFTITLYRFIGKPDRQIFLAGGIVGGVFEYTCSLATEILFGCTFWDYSYMPLNINGRTNVLFCIFWGIAAVVWMNVLYPPMSRWIEKMPAIAGKVLTWLLTGIILADALLSGAVLMRYHARHSGDTPKAGPVAGWIDTFYDDAAVEKTWPNLIETAADISK